MEAGQKCAAEVSDGVDWPVIKRCSSGPQGAELLRAYGDETNALTPKVSFIPTITLDGSQDGQKYILKDFQQEVCKKIKVRAFRLI